MGLQEWIRGHRSAAAREGRQYQGRRTRRVGRRSCGLPWMGTRPSSSNRLLPARSTPMQKDKDGRVLLLREDRTRLSHANERGHKSIVTLLPEKGASIESVDNGGRTPLWWAAWNGYEAVVKLLLKRGANTEPKDNDGWTPLLWAVQNGHEAIVKLLLEKGADLEAKRQRCMA